MATELQGSSLPCGLPGSFYFLSTNGSHVSFFSITLNRFTMEEKAHDNESREMLGVTSKLR
jgi:hypothetical protein